MLRSVQRAGLGVGIALILVAGPLYLIRPSLSLTSLVFFSVVGVWIWRWFRKRIAGFATRALARQNSKRARRLYFFLWLTSLHSGDKLSCRLSLVACTATTGAYELALERLDAMSEAPLNSALLAVFLNLRAYCWARSKSNLTNALEQVNRAIALRPHVAGFRHTRGLLYLELGEYANASRDLDGAWNCGDEETHSVLEAERCYDLGRLWTATGQHEYAKDYFLRAVQSAPDSSWAALS